MPGPRARQQGIALLLMLFLLVGAGTTLFLRSWNLSRQNIERDRITQQALQQAKDALLGRAVSSTSKPGYFPCPEHLASSPVEGQADSASCTTVATRIGRLPWKTLGLDKLLDGYGEPLWYVVSENFTAAPVNSSTVPALPLDGHPNTAVALIIAPGYALPGQNRTAPSPSAPPQAADYLDLGNAGGSAFVSTGPNATFNDKVMVITQNELLKLLQPRVLAEVRGLDDLTGGLRRYYNDNGNLFPWADQNGDGIADLGQLSGYIPWSNLVFDNTTRNWLINNNWFPLISYTQISSNSARVSLGSLVMKVTPCTAAPCP